MQASFLSSRARAAFSSGSRERARGVARVVVTSEEPLTAEAQPRRPPPRSGGRFLYSVSLTSVCLSLDCPS